MRDELANWKNRLVDVLIVALAAVVLAGVGWGLRLAALSPLFRVQVVEISLPETTGDGGGPPPVDEAALTRLVGLDAGEQSLFDVDLHEIESRILREPWIESVELTKQFPQTLLVAPRFRQARAVYAPNVAGAGVAKLQYMDANGVVFGRLDLDRSPDLPIVSGFDSESEAENAVRRKKLAAFIEAWSYLRPGGCDLDSIHWDSARGLWAVISGANLGRSSIWLGRHFDSDPTPRLQRIGRALTYLRREKIRPRQIAADLDGKIIVKVGPS